VAQSVVFFLRFHYVFALSFRVRYNEVLPPESSAGYIAETTKTVSLTANTFIALHQNNLNRLTLFHMFILAFTSTHTLLHSQVYAAMTAADPEAIWIMQGWLFLNKFWALDLVCVRITPRPSQLSIVE
jgi:hypothetical protein